MRVLCLRLLNPVTGDQDRVSSWLAIGGEYLVLSVSATREKTTFRILGTDASVKRITGADRQEAGLWDSSMFRTVSTSIPSNWVCEANEGRVALGPEAWLQPGFWVAYYDGDEEAAAVFERELAVMLQEDPSA